MEQGSIGPGIIAIHAAHPHPATLIGILRVTPYIIRCLTALEDMEYKGRTIGSLDILPTDLDEHPKTFEPATQCLGPHVGPSAQLPP